MTKRSTSISLTAEMDAVIHDLVGTGVYANASEVIRAGLRALEAQAVRAQATRECACGALADELRALAERIEAPPRAGLRRAAK